MLSQEGSDQHTKNSFIILWITILLSRAIRRYSKAAQTSFDVTTERASFDTGL